MKTNRKTTQTLKHILNFHRFWIGWWNKNIPYLAEKASNRPLKFSIFTCNPMGGLFSVVPPLDGLIKDRHRHERIKFCAKGCTNSYTICESFTVHDYHILYRSGINLINHHPLNYFVHGQKYRRKIFQMTVIDLKHPTSLILYRNLHYRQKNTSLVTSHCNFFASFVKWDPPFLIKMYEMGSMSLWKHCCKKAHLGGTSPYALCVPFPPGEILNGGLRGIFFRGGKVIFPDFFSRREMLFPGSKFPFW